MDTTTNDFKFQELCRIVDATTSTYNHEGLITGISCLTFIETQIPYIKDYVSPGLYDLIQQELILSQNKTNVREHVKRILTYPLKGYLPWKIYKYENEYFLNEDILSTVFRFVVRDGKIYASPNRDICQLIYDSIKPPNTIVNSESSHITLVNSNVVADIGINNVKRFVSEFSNVSFQVDMGDIKFTTSYDWPVFAECYVIEIFSDVISQFITEFNNEFNKKVNPALHLTFAIVPRSLF